MGNLSIWVALDQSMVRAFLRSLGSTDRELARAGYMNERAGYVVTSRFAAVGMVLFAIMLLIACGGAFALQQAAQSLPRSSMAFDSNPPQRSSLSSATALTGLVFIFYFVIYGAAFAFCYWLWRRSTQNVAILDQVFAWYCDQAAPTYNRT
jgi:hypothetical protein